MNRKAFTLIELLAVIILFGILVTIVISLVDDNIKYAKTFASTSQIRLLEDAAKLYYQNYKSEIPSIETNNIVTITVDTLLEKGFIKEKDLKINDKASISEDNYIIIYLIEKEAFALYDDLQSTNPIIVLKGPKQMKIRINGSYSEYGAVILNTVAMTITELGPGNIYGVAGIDVTIEDTYEIEYSYPEAKTVTRYVTVEAATTEADVNKPTITLNGNSTINISLGGSYVESGAIALDDEDGNISARITISGKVTTSQRGTYYIYYDVSDNVGNKATTVTRTINVN